MADGQLGQVIRHLRQLVGGRPTSAGSDGQLLERFVSTKDEAAFETLVQRHGQLVLGVCRRVLRDAHAVDDAFQATFVVLACKAASISKHDSVGSWLYGVAHRTALRAKMRADRRRNREMSVSDMSDATPADQADPLTAATRREFAAVLDEELQRLPEKSRAPLVLCYLRGLTHEQAAAELRCPTGSMSHRLAQAREQLQARLSRRGVTLSATALATVLAETASAQVPAILMRSTVQAALRGAVDLGTASLSSEVLALSQGVLQTMWVNQMKIVALFVLSLGVIGSGVGVLSYRSLSGNAAATPVPAEKARPDAGVQGLKLTLEADKTETVMKADGSIEPVNLKISFINVGDKPIKLDAYDLTHSKVKLEVTGPDPQSVEMLKRAAKRELSPPTPQNFPSIETGKSWVYDGFGQDGWIPFGTTWFHDTKYRLLKPGEYRIKLAYANPREMDNPLAKGSWVGEVTSNNLVVKVKPAGDDKKAEPKGETLSLTPNGATIQLLPGYTHQKKQGADSNVGKIEKKDGLVVEYDIGAYGAKSLENELWHKEQTLHGKKVKLVFSKKKELLVAIDSGKPSGLRGNLGVSFYTQVKSEEDVAEALLLILSFRFEK